MLSDRSFFVLNMSLSWFEALLQNHPSLWRSGRAGQSGKPGVQNLDGLVVINMVKRGEEIHRMVREPDRPRLIFPDQHAQGQVKPDRLPALHQGRSGLRVAEDQYLRWPQAEFDLVCFGGMVNVR